MIYLNENVGLIEPKNKFNNYENISKGPANGTEVDAYTRNKILNVDNFNDWLKSKNFPVFGVELSPSLIEDYFFDQGVQCEDHEIFDFINKIQKEWNKPKLENLKSWDNFIK
jgi:hypothetical protein